MDLSRDEVRRPDVVTAELKKGFEWTTQHSRIVGVVLALLLLGGVAWAGYSLVEQNKEQALQEKYYQIERGYVEKKQKFDLYKSTAGQAVDPKTKQAPKPQGEAPTGDLTKDYGATLTGFEDLVKEAPRSKAAALAALTLSGIYSEYQKKNESLAVLGQVNASGLLGLLVQSEKGTLQANLGDCKTAIETWQNLLKNKASGFMSAQTKLKIGICSESLGQKEQAANYYRQVVSDGADSAAAKSAQQYLSLLDSASL